jgi:hypothetical protein
LAKFTGWTEDNKYVLETIGLEMPLVSDLFGYGGIIDWYGTIGGQSKKKWLLDFKTGGGLYPEDALQIAAYWSLLVENHLEVDGVRLLRLGREDSGITDRVLTNTELDDAWETFCAAMKLYKRKGLFDKAWQA